MAAKYKQLLRAAASLQMDAEHGKKLAAYRAVDTHIDREGLVIGVGSGSTVRYVVRDERRGWHGVAHTGA